MSLEFRHLPRNIWLAWLNVNAAHLLLEIQSCAFSESAWKMSLTLLGASKLSQVNYFFRCQAYKNLCMSTDHCRPQLIGKHLPWNYLVQCSYNMGGASSKTWSVHLERHCEITLFAHSWSREQICNISTNYPFYIKPIMHSHKTLWEECG